MAGKKRSGLANDRRAYCYSSSRHYPITQLQPVIPTTYTVSYNDNNKTTGNASTDGSLYAPGSTVTVLGNSGSSVLVKPGFTFVGWNTAENGSGTSYSPGNTFTINANIILYPQ